MVFEHKWFHWKKSFQMSETDLKHGPNHPETYFNRFSGRLKWNWVKNKFLKILNFLPPSVILGPQCPNCLRTYSNGYFRSFEVKLCETKFLKILKFVPPPAPLGPPMSKWSQMCFNKYLGLFKVESGEK